MISPIGEEEEEEERGVLYRENPFTAKELGRLERNIPVTDRQFSDEFLIYSAS